jgi:hypothetical protein
LTDQLVSLNHYGYDIDEVIVIGLNVNLESGMTYWLNLQNAVVPSGDPVYRDENSGKGCDGNGCPSSASENTLGTIPSESFTINGNGAGTTPEPGSVVLLASGAIALAGVLRRNLL